MGGILAGPAVLDCSTDSDGLGACLRDRLVNSGLLAPIETQTDMPMLISELPVTPELPVSGEPAVAVEPPKPVGWIEARAGEFAGDMPAAAALSAPAGALDIAIAPVPVEAGQAALVAPGGQLRATATPPPVMQAELALAPKLGALQAGGGLGAGPSLEAGAAPLVGPSAQIAATGGIGSGTATAAAELSAPLPVPEPEPEAVPEPAPVFETPLVEISAELPPAPPVIEPPPPIRFDPDYPNVLVLPAPASGEDSSFRTLQLN